MVEFPGGGKQADAALLDQIQQRHAPAGILPGNGDHQPQIGIDHTADRIFVPLGAKLSQFQFLLGSEPGILADLAQKLAHVLIAGAYGGGYLLMEKHRCHALIPFLSFSLF